MMPKDGSMVGHEVLSSTNKQTTNITVSQMIFLDYEKQRQQYLSVTPLGFNGYINQEWRNKSGNKTMKNSISYQKGVQRPIYEADL